MTALTMTTKASHLLTQTARRKYPLFILLFIFLIIIYPFTSTFLPGLSALESQYSPADPLSAHPPLPPSSESLSATEIPASTLLARPISNDRTTIPKIIHQTWFPAGTNMSASAKEWVNTIKRFHPEWEYVLWDDESNEELVRRYFPWFLETYRSLPKEINRADMARNFYMFLFGGMYADVDTESLRPVDSLFVAHDVALNSHEAILSSFSPPAAKMQRAFMGRMAHTLDPEGLGAIPNGWMASPPGHPFFLLPVLAVQANPTGDGSVEGMTGPGILGPLIKQYFGHGNDPSVRANLRRQLCARVREAPGGRDWDLFCPVNVDGEWSDQGEELGHSLVLLPREQIYPFSWADDGDVKSCLGSKANVEGFDPAECKRRMDVDAWPSYFITYCTHTW